LLNDVLTGEEAERIGLVSLCVDDDEVHDRALEIARRLAAGPAEALSFTKHALNNWLRLAGPTFDASLAMEFFGFTGPDVREGVAATREKRPPRFTRGAAQLRVRAGRPAGPAGRPRPGRRARSRGGTTRVSATRVGGDRSVRLGQAQLVLRDVGEDEFLGDRDVLGDADIAEHPGDRVLHRVRHAAERLERAVGGLPGRVRRGEL